MSVATKTLPETPRRKAPTAGRDVRQEEHLRAIAALQRLNAMLGLVGGGLMLVVGAATGAGGERLALALAVLCVAASTLYASQGLWRYEAWGRSGLTALQGLVILQGVVMLLRGSSALAALPQMCWAGIVAAVLLSARTTVICTPAYRAQVERSPEVAIRWWTSPFCYVPAGFLALSLLGLLAFLVLLFALH